MLWTIIAGLVLLWFVGLIAQIGGVVIHGLFLIAAVLLIYRLISGRYR